MRDRHHLRRATPTEAGTFGVIGAMILTKFTGGLSLKKLGESLMSAMKISCMIPFIVACAAVPSIAVGFLNIAQFLASTVQAMNLSPAMLLVVLALFFLVLGCFLVGISILVLSSAVVLPMVQAAGIDLVWFGIYIITVRAGCRHSCSARRLTSLWWYLTCSIPLRAAAFTRSLPSRRVGFQRRGRAGRL